MKIFVVGLGPGGWAEMTPRALAALEQSDVIFGYDTYIDLIRSRFAHKTLKATPMTKEIDRCRQTLAEAARGRTVALISSGDAGVYGMAGALLEVAGENPEVEVEIVPGITAACSAAAALGAPLTHDFAVISLSDLLTPWEKIVNRLECAAKGDFVICLYNPSSKKRKDYLQKACRIIAPYKSPSTPAGWVKNSGRPREERYVGTLAELENEEVDMFTTVIIGNSQTRLIQGRMVTPRGYRELI